MRIKSIHITNHKPITNLEISNLGDIVIIAGANGSGKTRLKQALVTTMKGNPQLSMTIEATRKDEIDPKYFGAKELKIIQGQKNQILTNYIKSRQYGSGRYVGSLVQIDSDRSIKSLQYSQVNWLGGDPDDAVVPSNFYFNAFTNRWQDFVNYIHQKSASRDKKLADQLKLNPSDGEKIIDKNPDPFKKYQRIFANLLPGKKLLDINPAQPQEFQYQDESGQNLNFQSLSSGEQEVIKVLFDVARKEIKHSVIIVDEPELHLHPTLTFKLIESLKAIGEHTNQFIFLTHSADLISTYYSTGNVYFIDSSQTGSNQAHRLSDLNHSHNDLVQLIGENLGLFAVGKKIVFVEGKSSSIDRLTYHKIAQSVNSDLKISPVGSVVNIGALKAVESQLRNSVFGVSMYMLRDRDGLRQDQIDELEEGKKLICLKRRHIENYFLNETILHKVAKHLYLEKDGLVISENRISTELKRIASESIGFNLYKNFKEHVAANYSIKVPKVTSIETKTTQEIKTQIAQGLNDSISALATDFATTKTLDWLNHEEQRLNSLLTNEQWKIEFQGKIIFSKLCGEVLRGNALSIRECYVDIALKEGEEGILEIADIFKQM
jgi:predicted ATPase